MWLLLSLAYLHGARLALTAMLIQGSQVTLFDFLMSMSLMPAADV